MKVSRSKPNDSTDSEATLHADESSSIDGGIRDESDTQPLKKSNTSVDPADEATIALPIEFDAQGKLVPTDPHTSRIEQWANANQVSFDSVEYHSGDYLLTQGDAPIGLILIDEGAVRVVDRANGHVIDRQNAPGVFGEMSLLTGETCSADVIAEVDTKARILPAESYHACQKNSPEVERMLAGLASTRLGHHTHDALCGKVLDRYRIKHCIARGGMGVVYEAEVIDSDPTEKVAIKMLMHRYIDNESMQQRFADEASMLAQLDHPNINRLVGHFSEYRTHFLVLEYCDGADMSSFLREHGAPSNQQIRDILRQVAAGLSLAHEQGIIHRDLKLNNLLINRQGIVQIADFGLSQLRGLQPSGNLLVGTPAYMAPELFRCGDLGVQADYYALGCLTYQLVTQRTLFPRQKLVDLIQKKNHFRPDVVLTSEHLRAHRQLVQPNDAVIDEQVRRWMVTALQADPAERNLDLAAMMA